MEIDSTNPELIYYQLELPFGQNQVMFINNAVIDDVQRVRGTIYVTITFERRFRPEQSAGSRWQQIVLVVTNQTRIQDNSGREVSDNQLRPGRRINALTSARMTFSEPPQTQAFIIIINSRRRRNEVAEGRIVDVDRRRDSFTIRERDRDDDDRDRGRDRDDDDDGRRNRIRFFVDENTRIQDRNGRPMAFR